MNNRRRNLLISILLPLFLAAMGFSNFSQDARTAAIRTLDIIRLTGFGMCIGVALTSFFSLLNEPKT